MKFDLTKNTIVCGDNLEWLKDISDESIDLCYIDPPFFSNRNYEVIWGNGAEVASFGDRFSGGIEKYIDWMTPRTEEIHRVLKNTGSIFLHCDHHASHRLRCLLDDIFGEKNFKNEIIWTYTTGGTSKKWFGKKHDNIYFYAKKASKCKFYIYQEKSYFTMPRHKLNPDMECGKRLGVKEDDDGVYRMVNARDIWRDINALFRNNTERLGYKTQKPIQLLKRIIECSTDENDIVLDCFAGGFTTANACLDLNRKFISGDVSPVSIQIGSDRLLALCPNAEFEIKGLPRSIDEFKSLDGHEFAELISEVMGWTCNPKKSGDGGKDAWDGNKNPIEIKNGFKNSVGRTVVQKLHSRVIADKKEYGAIVGWNFSKQAVEYASDLKNNHGIIIELKDAEKILAPLILPKDRSEKIKKLYEDKKPKFQRDDDYDSVA